MCLLWKNNTISKIEGMIMNVVKRDGQVVDYDKNDKVINDSNIPSSRSNIIPETVGESIAETAKEILSKKD